MLYEFGHYNLLYTANSSIIQICLYPYFLLWSGNKFLENSSLIET